MINHLFLRGDEYPVIPPPLECPDCPEQQVSADLSYSTFRNQDGDCEPIWYYRRSGIVSGPYYGCAQVHHEDVNRPWCPDKGTTHLENGVQVYRAGDASREGGSWSRCPTARQIT